MIPCRRWRRMVILLSLFCMVDKRFLFFRKSKTTTRTITTLINGFLVKHPQNYISQQQPLHRQHRQHRQLCSIKCISPTSYHQHYHNPSIRLAYSVVLSNAYYYDNVKNRFHYYNFKNLYRTALSLSSSSSSSPFQSTTTETTTNHNNNKNVHHVNDVDIKFVVNSSNKVQFQNTSYRNHRYASTINDIDIDNNNSLSSEIWLIVGDGDLSYSSWLAQSLISSQKQQQQQQQQQQQEEQQQYHKDSRIQKKKTDNSITKHITIIASVLEDEHTHRTIYKDSKINHDTIVSMNNNMLTNNNTNENHIVQYKFYVRYNIDATKLEYIFTNNNTDTDTSNLSSNNKLYAFNRIIFNFPHIVGKNNIRYNRLLVHQFFKSACTVLDTSKSGGQQIDITLFSKQSGYESICDREWKNSWQIPIIASENGLIIKDIQSFIPYYKLSSYRGIDKSFITTTNTKQYTFTWPTEYNALLPTTTTTTTSSSSSSTTIKDYATYISTNQHSTSTNNNYNNIYEIDEQYQLAVRQEIRIVLDPSILQNLTNTVSNFASNTLIYGSIIPTIIQNCIPSGYRSVIAPNRSILFISGIASHITNNNTTNIDANNLLDFNFEEKDNNNNISNSNNNNNKENSYPTSPDKENKYPILVFSVAYVGVNQPMTIDIGNTIRTIVENTIQQQLHGIHISKKNYPVSHPFPIRIYNNLIQKVEQRMKLQQNTIIITPHEQQQQNKQSDD